MPKSKLSEFKQLIAQMDETELREELMRLYNKLPLVKDFYNQDLMTEEERQEVLKTYKSKVYKEYWTSRDNPKIPNNTNVKKILEEYEKIAVFPYDIIDLLIYRVETNTDHANTFGGTSDGSYNTSITSFKKAMKLIADNNLQSHFEERCNKILKAKNIDYWYIEQLEILFDETFDDTEN
jgi:Family of unknown function (DUF6155)